MLPAIVLCSVAHCVPAPPQETVEEVLADGRTIRKTLISDGGGSTVEEGPFQVLDSKNRMTVEGEMEAGRRTGRWTYRGRDGKAIAAGRYRDDLRAGAWTFSWPGGKKRASGKFRRGTPVGKWKFFDERGAPDAALSGELEHVEWTSRATGMTGHGFLLDGRLHGPWEVRWPDQTLCLSVTFVRDKVAGPVRYFPSGGIPGERIFEDGASSLELPGLMFHALDRVGDPVLPASPPPTAAADVLRASARWPALVIKGDRATVEAHVGEFFEGGATRSEVCMKDALRWAFGELREVDWSTQKAKLDEPAFEVIFECLGRPDSGKAFLREPAEHLVRYQGEFLLHFGDTFYWSVDVRLQGASKVWLRGDEITYLLRSMLEPTWGAEVPTRSRRAKGKEKEALVARESGAAWLAGHQDSDGRWNCDGFMEHDPAGDECDGKGDQLHDVGVTGLAVLALQSAGSTATTGPHRDAIARGIGFLVESQDPRTGRIGPLLGHAFIYDHSVAVLALCDVRKTCKSPRLRRAIEAGAQYIMAQQVAGSGWGYVGMERADTSVTGWQVRALAAAQMLGIEVGSDHVPDAIRWFDQVTDPETGRAGYTEPGSTSSRVLGKNDQFPTEYSEALTAVALLGRFALGQSPDDAPVMKQHANLILTVLPDWAPRTLSCDMYYWYNASYAMKLMGGRHATTWHAAVVPAIVDSQRIDDSAAGGSWDPVGAWGFAGGRVYSTALALLCLAE